MTASLRHPALLALWLLTMGLLVMAGCGDAEPVRYATAVQTRTSVVLEPPVLQVGDVASLDIVVVTPPDHGVRPLETPDELDGVWILETRTLPVERGPQRWIHTTRVRVRAREVGTFEWPASAVSVEIPDAEVRELTVEPVSLEVVSVFPDYPGRLAPFGVEPTRSTRSPSVQRGAWAAAGSAATLAVLGLVWLARRRSEAGVDQPPADDPGPTPWDVAQQALGQARAVLFAGDALAGSQRAGTALRHYMSQRYGADALARTTQELDAMQPPFAATSKWPVFVSLLVDLDELRFPPGDAADTRRRADALLSRADQLVESTVPRETPRATHGE